MNCLALACGIVHSWACALVHQIRTARHLLAFARRWRSNPKALWIDPPPDLWRQTWRRVLTHDLSRFRWDETLAHARFTSRLHELLYNPDRYAGLLLELRESFGVHYARNGHHPEHYDGRIAEMTPWELIEMCADWCVSACHGCGRDECFACHDRLCPVDAESAEKIRSIMALMKGNRHA